MASLAPSKVEQEQRILFLTEEVINRRNQESGSIREKFVSSSVPSPQVIYENLKSKMTKLADFLKDNFRKKMKPQPIVYLTMGLICVLEIENAYIKS